MTIEERFERIEHVTAGLAEEWRKDREESRQLWRDTQRQLDQLADRVNGLADRVGGIAIQMDRFILEAAARDRETDQRFRDTDARIDKLVSAIGEFMRKQGGQV